YYARRDRKVDEEWRNSFFFILRRNSLAAPASAQKNSPQGQREGVFSGFCADPEGWLTLPRISYQSPGMPTVFLGLQAYCQVAKEMFSLTVRTLPSARAAFMPPRWSDWA